MGGTTVSLTWQGRRVDAWLPDPIADLAVDLRPRTVRRTEQAAAAVVRTGDRATGAMEVAARLLLRAEGLASSAIEGVRAGAAEVAVAEAVDADTSSTAGWVADNLAVVDDALARPGTLNRTLLWRWHRRLMRHADLSSGLVGAWRDRLGWVGGANPLVAAHVAAPHAAIPQLMDDLFAFVARDDIDPVTQAAVAHAQFEVIHPFADGNGRIGRILVVRILAHRLRAPVPPPVSQQFARDVGGYLSGLTRYRQGDVEGWVSWFADAVEAAAVRSGAVLDAVATLLATWHQLVGDLRADAAARRLVDHLPAHPVLNAAETAALLEISEQAARVALGRLAERGILTETTVAQHRAGRRTRWFVADGLLALLGEGMPPTRRRLARQA